MKFIEYSKFLKGAFVTKWGTCIKLELAINLSSFAIAFNIQ